MNDFLYNLASRALSVETDIKPRPSSIFEPMASASAPASAMGEGSFGIELPDVEFDLEGKDIQVALHSPHPQLRNANARSQASDPLGSEPVSDRILSIEEKRDGPDRHHHTSRSIDEHDADAASGQLSSIAEHALLRPRSVLLTDDDKKGGEKSLASEVAVKRIRNVVRPTLSDSDDSIDKIDARSTEALESGEFSSSKQRDSLLVATPAPRMLTISDIHDGSVAGQNAAVMHNVLGAKHSRSDWPLPQPRITSEPPVSENVINVTIGRIEVRATPAPAVKPRRDEQTRSVMSLDDYLRQRTGSDRGGGG